MRRVVILLASIILLSGCNVGDQASKVPETKPDASAKVEDIYGKYRMNATPDEVAESGGLDSLPTLFLSKEGKFSLAVDGESATGTFTYSAGILILKDSASGEETKFHVMDGGVEISDASDPSIGFLKLGAVAK